MPKRVIILLHPGFEEMEAVAPIDLLGRAGVEVVQASTGDDPAVTGRSGITLRAGVRLDAVVDEDFGAVILPGGPGIAGLRGDERITGLLRRHHRRGALVACICAAPLILLDAGLIAGVPHTAHPSTAEELPDALEDPVVWSNRILTSRGAGTATLFALALVRELASAEEAGTIADAICAGVTSA